MNREILLEKAKVYLHPEEVREELLAMELDRWAETARSYLRLLPGEALPPATEAQVVYNAVASYHANGNEGLVSSNLGGQSYNYADLEQGLKRIAVSEREPRL